MRIERAFSEAQNRGKKLLITYLTAGDPSLADTERLVLAMERGGADIVELGIPFSDPLADGPVIQRAAVRALRAGTRVSEIMALVQRLRAQTEIPLVFLVYFNQVYQYGLRQFLIDCDHSGIDGLVIADLPWEERQAVTSLIKELGLAVRLIPLVAPTSSERIAKIVGDAEGFIYCVSSVGVTGQRRDFAANLSELIADIRAVSSLPIAIGFGIGDEQAVRQLRGLADALIVGSALVTEVERGQIEGSIEERLEGLVYRLAGALHDK